MSAANKNILVRIFKFREAGILFALILLCVITAIFNPRFLLPGNLTILSRRSCWFALIAIGETFVIITQGIDLSPGSLLILIGVVCAWFMKLGSSMQIPAFINIPGAILLALITAAAIGYYHGVFVTKLSVPPFVITLGTYLMARSAAEVITGGGTPIPITVESFAFISRGMMNLFPALILLIIAGLSWMFLQFSVTGRHIYAIGGNIEAARLSGINIDNKRILVYIISSVLAGITGIIIASYLRQGQVNLNEPYELYAIAAAVIGGTSLFGGEGTILGTVIGAAILGVINNILVFWNVPSYWQKMVIGLVLVVAVTLDIQRRRTRT